MNNYKTVYYQSHTFRSSYGHISFIYKYNPSNIERVSSPLGGGKFVGFCLKPGKKHIPLDGERVSLSNEIFLFKRIKYLTLIENRKEDSSENHGI